MVAMVIIVATPFSSCVHVDGDKYPDVKYLTWMNSHIEKFRVLHIKTDK